MNLMKKVYVVAPAHFKTGGTELAHQLVWQLVHEGVRAEIAYVDSSKYDDPINPAFMKYVKSWCSFDEIKDCKNNVIIFPEIYTEMALSFHNAYKVIWWMSVDNYKNFVSFRSIRSNYGIMRAFYYTMHYGQLCKRKTKNEGVLSANLHLYQSEYARVYLETLKIKNMLPLSDFINDTYLSKPIVRDRENIVLYNPQKGYRFTKKIIRKSPELNWVAIENLSTDEVADLLNKSKVYIDFGNHPGKDRFPREAAISGCCVITGKRGAAKNTIDIPINDKYKFDDKSSNIKFIIAIIKECLTNYDNLVNDFIDYRKMIENEKKIFKENTINFIKMIESV